MSRATVGRLGLLATLYFAQGLPFGFFVQAIPSILREEGVSLSKVGLSSLLAMPWALKFLWAPTVDRRYSSRLGRRRTWILAMQLAATAILAALVLVPGANELAVLMVAMLALNLVAATQDIATDGLAVELLPPAERGIANGLQVAGYRVGMLVGGGVLLGIYADHGHVVMFALMTALTALASVPVLIAREPATVAAAPDVPPAREPHFLSLPGAWTFLAILVAYKFGDEAAKAMIRPFLIDQGLGLRDIARILGTVGFIAGMAGALTGGALVGRLGRKRALIVFGLGQVLAVLGYAYLAFVTPTRAELYAAVAFEHFASGCATASLFTAMMDRSRPTTSGTDYTVQASAVVIATGAAGILGGVSAELVGYAPHFVGCAVLALGAVAVVIRLFPTEVR